MLDSDFKEGRAFRERNGRPAEIELPTESPDTVWNAFSTLYGADPKMKYLKISQIQDVVILADKYQMTDRFTFAGVYWLRQGQSPSSESTWRLMTAAYLLKMPRYFFHFSGLLVAKKDLSLTKFAFQTHDRMLGLKLCCKMSPVPLSQPPILIEAVHG